MIRLIADAARLTARDRALAARAVAWLAIARIAVRLLPFRTVRRVLHALPARRRAAPATVVECEHAVRRAARVLPSSRCMALACAGAALLRREGRESVLTIHVNLAGGRRLDAHASRVADGIAVAGGGARAEWPGLVSDRIQP